MVHQAKTKLSLSRWAEIMGINPLHFNQVYLEGVNVGCDEVWLQYQWQSADKVSREELAFAIAEAESKIEQYLGYHLAPDWNVDEWHKNIRPFVTDLFSINNVDARGFPKALRADWGYFISGGIQSKVLVGADQTITYEDLNNDGYPEKASLVIATDALDKSEICLFYPGKDGEDEWEIKPIEVVIASGNATITFRRELVIKPDYLDPFVIIPVEGTDDTFFLETVDVYRRYNDPQLQANFLWEPFATGGCGSCDGSGCSQCAYTAQNGCLILRSEPRQSIVAFHPGDWNGTTFEFDRSTFTYAREPDLVRLYYYSGYRDKSQKYTNRMSADWERTVAYMACAYLDRPVCTCIQHSVDHWRDDLGVDVGNEDTSLAIYRTPNGILDNPFGSHRGEINAWRKVRTLAVMDSAPVR